MDKLCLAPEGRRLWRELVSRVDGSLREEGRGGQVASLELGSLAASALPLSKTFSLFSGLTLLGAFPILNLLVIFACASPLTGWRVSSLASSSS